MFIYILKHLKEIYKRRKVSSKKGGFSLNSPPRLARVRSFVSSSFLNFSYSIYANRIENVVGS